MKKYLNSVWAYVISSLIVGYFWGCVVTIKTKDKELIDTQRRLGEVTRDFRFAIGAIDELSDRLTKFNTNKYNIVSEK